jgi:glycine/D-amino acid oxidase-like deaminating enzyme
VHIGRWSLTIWLYQFSGARQEAGTPVAQPRDAQVTVIGGGAVGAAAAYFLASEGYADIQLLDKQGLCEATSSQAAGLVGQARPTADRARLTMAAAELYRSFERKTGYSMDYRECGAVRVALSETSVAELQQIAETARLTGLPVEFMTERRLREVLPVLERTDGIKAALFSPTCGYLQPNSLVAAYASAARDLGVTIAPSSAVTALGIRRGVVHSISTRDGEFATELVVVAAGPWSAALAKLAGLELPIVPVLHEYFVTDPVPGWHAGLPCLRIPEIQVYARGEGERVLCGGFESQGTSLDPRGVTVASPLRASPNWDVLADFAAGLDQFVPGLSEAGVSATFQGWPAFTPDGRFVVGPVSSIRGLVFAAGCNAHGVSGSAGLAQHLLESLSPDPSPYVRSLSPDRFLPRTWSWEDAERQARGVYETYYPMPQATAGS